MNFRPFANMNTKLIYEIVNPFTLEPFFVGETSDMDARKEAHKLWAGNTRLAYELQDIRSAGKEPLYNEVERVESKDAVKRLAYWVEHRLNCGAHLLNRLPDPKKKSAKTQKVQALCEVNLTRTLPFRISLPCALAEDPRFKTRLSPDLSPTDFLSVYVGQLIVQDFAKEEESSLIDFIDWLYD